MNWFADWFNEDYLKVYSHRTIESALPESEFAQRILSLQPGDHILDLCCGNGRHLAGLFNSGLTQLTGLDRSLTLLLEARKNLDMSIQMVQGDMRHLPFTNSFDAVLMFFTSFGYFESDEENHNVLKELYHVLKTRGKFLLDLVSPSIVHRIVPQTIRQIEGLLVTENRTFDSIRKRLSKTITIESSGITRKYLESVRIFQPEEMAEWLEKSGFAISNLYGDFDGSAFDGESPRMIFTGQKTPMRG